MTSDSRVLIAIAAGAALAGWLMVRFIGADDERPATQVAAVEQVEDEAAPAEPATTTEPREGAPRADAPTPAADDPESIAQELAVIASALSKDKFMQNRAFPDDTTILEMPSVIAYLRAVDFWEPVFPNAARELR